LETICDLAMPCLSISAFTRNTGMPAFVAFVMAPMLSFAPAGSSTIALTLALIAASMKLLCCAGSFLWA